MVQVFSRGTRARVALILGLILMSMGFAMLAGPAPSRAAPAGSALRQTCDNPPDQDATVTPKCGAVGTRFLISVFGFTPNESLSFFITDPNGNVVGTERPLQVQHPGRIDNLPLDTSQGGFYEGIWAITFVGAQSQHTSIRSTPRLAAGASAS
jgi:hypothetical protein